MRIVLFSWRDIGNPRAGGAEIATFEHMRHWATAGHQVTLFTARYPGAAVEDRRAGVHVVRRGSQLTVHIAAQHWYRHLRVRPDLVVDEVHGVPFGALAYAKTPVVAWIYEVARDIWFRMFPLPVALAGRLVEAATLHWYARQQVPFVADSQSTANDLTAVGVSPTRLTVIEPAIRPVPLDTLTEKERTPTLLFVGRLVRTKGVEDAIQALLLVQQRHPACQLWIIGRGPGAYEVQLRHLVNQLGLAGSVHFLGRVDDAEKLQRMQRAHLLIHPSQREGWGINVIEANAMGTPAVAYRVPGLRDSIVDGETGLLSGYGRPSQLAASVCSLLEAPDKYEAMRRTGLQWSRRFTWEAAADRSLRLLTRVVAEQ